MSRPILQFEVREEQDVLLVRRSVKEIALLAGLSVQDQTRLVTAVSEIVRNAFQYAGGGRLEFDILDQDNKQFLRIVIRDSGPGIANVSDILSGNYKSRTGMGRGIVGARKLVDLFSIESSAETGTTVSLSKQLPEGSQRVTTADAAAWTNRLPKSSVSDLMRELQEQNKQLLQSLGETQTYKLELEQQLQQVHKLNKELETTNKGILALYKDLDESKTELLKKTELLEKQRQQLQEATRHKSEFLANMSHEIRTPMNGVLGMTEILLTSGLTDKQREYASTIREAGKALLSIINDVLDFSKIEAGKLTLEITEFEPARLLEDIAELLASQARQNNLSLLTFIDPEIPSILRGDPVRLRQIIMNFVGNAIKFSENGSILMRSALESQDGRSAKIKFSVTDPGIGMTDEEVSRLFEPFVQSDGTTTRKYGGTGLGLSISKRLVELMGGEIKVTTVKGHGSTFSFTIPILLGNSRPLKHLAPPNLAGLRVLVVDDDPSACEIIHTYLISWGLRNGIATSTKEAFSILTSVAPSDRYDVAIVDLVMPGGDGLQLGKAVRENALLKDTKLILITAFDKPGIGEEAIQLGFDAFLTKPLRQSQLLNAITSVVYESQVECSTPSAKAESDTVLSSSGRLSRSELILVAEDHPVNQEVALLLLKGLGFEAHIAANGVEVLEKLERTSYSLVFMDCQMPILDGFETTRRIRKLEVRSGKHIPIIAMTAHAIEGSREQCIGAGMDDYISKPIDPQRLRQLLDAWLPDSGESPMPDAQNHIDTQVLVPIDIAALGERYGKEHTQRLLQIFLDQSTPQLEAIKQSVANTDLQELLKTIHGLKGVSASLFVDKLRQICVAIEDAGREENWNVMPSLVEQLQQEFQATLEYVRQNLETS